MTTDGDLTLDEWAACAEATWPELQREIDALSDVERRQLLDAIRQQLAPPTPPLPD